MGGKNEYTVGKQYKKLMPGFSSLMEQAIFHVFLYLQPYKGLIIVYFYTGLKNVFLTYEPNLCNTLYIQQPATAKNTRGNTRGNPFS